MGISVTARAAFRGFLLDLSVCVTVSIGVFEYPDEK
jgi:hypothetical protein